MIGTHEIRDVVHDKIELAIDKVLYDSGEDNIYNMMKLISDYGNVLSKKDMKRIARLCYERVLIQMEHVEISNGK